MEEKNYEAIVEAILFTMGESVELEKIAAALELDKKETKKIIEHLMKEYEKPSIGMKIIELDTFNKAVRTLMKLNGSTAVDFSALNAEFSALQSMHFSNIHHCQFVHLHLLLL